MTRHDPPPNDETVARAPDARVPSRERFTPGTLLADRFRIIAPLGRGGMGEVYRADDTKLGQPVALKFLPATIDSGSDRLQRLYAEVRMGRQVSHPNVCRLYDISEFDGMHFIAMEYIDGEDLGSLLRRIGKLPYEKALDLTRDICAGLAAAHGVGIVHRDLKPANVMIDGRGRARLTDFGLAALEQDLGGTPEIAGTPAYMAPEQASGKPATQRSDLYSLGLIVYEMFTGKRGADLRSGAGRERSQSHATISQHTKDLDPAIQRVIVRCLEPEPEARPTSIHAVIAALPGGDPLQAAIDAGETPSPDMVAAAGVTGELPARVAVPMLLLAIALVLGAVALFDRIRTTSIIALPKRPEALAERAREIARGFGYTEEPVDVWYRFTGLVVPVSQWAHQRGDTRVMDHLADLRPSILRFLYRESPREMMPLFRGHPIQVDDPPFVIPGMIRVALEPDGRLTSFMALPSSRQPSQAAAQPVNWTPVLAAAGFDPRSLRSVPAELSVNIESDQKEAWAGTYPGQPDVPMQITAASYRGKPVYFSVRPPWSPPPEGRQPIPPLLVRITTGVFPVTLLSALIASLFLARRSLRRGRADRAGATRVAVFTFVCSLAASLLLWAEHSATVATELSRTVLPSIAEALLPACVIWLFYVALEPYLRRRWPHTLIGWSRLIGGRVGDPLVGRDILVGVIAGAITSFSVAGGALLLKMPISPRLAALDDDLAAVGLIADQAAVWTTNTLGLCMVLLLAHIVLRNRIAAVIATFIVTTFAWPVPQVDFAIFWAVATSAFLVGLLVRFGVLTTAVALFVSGLTAMLPVTLDSSKWFFGSSVWMIAAIAALAVYGFYRSLGAVALFSGAVLDD